jgi:hypothetical protein
VGDKSTKEAQKVMDSILAPVFGLKKKKNLDVLVVIVSHMLRDSLSIVVISMVHCDER